MEKTNRHLRRARRELRDANRLLSHARGAQLLAVAERAAVSADRVGRTVASLETDIQAEYARHYDAWYGGAPDRPAPRASGNDILLSRWLLAASIITVLLDFLFSAWAMSAFTSLPSAAAIAVGVGVALGLTTLAKGLALLVVERFDLIPRAAYAELRCVAAVLGPVVFLSFVVLFIVRSDGDGLGTILAPAFGSVCALLSVFLPMLGGLLLALRSMKQWICTLSSLWLAAEAIEREIVALRGRCQRLHTAGGVTQADADWIEAPRSLYGTRPRAHRSLGVTAILSIGSFAYAESAVAQQIRVFVDISPSVSLGQGQAARHELVRLAPQLSERYAVTRWTITEFASDSWGALPVHVEWPASAVPACPAVTLTEAERVVRVMRERKETRARISCEAIRDSAAGRVRAARDSAVRQLSAALATPSAVVARCTAIADLLARIGVRAATTRDLTVVVTDAIESCSDRLRPVRAPAGSARTVIVLLQGADSRVGPRNASFEERRAALLRAAPWVRVVPLGDIEDELLNGQDPPPRPS